jgi:glutaminyl-tRNA synthetase
VTKADTRIEPEKLDFAIRDTLNTTAPRVMGVLRPLRVVVTSWPEGKVEWLDAASFPADVGKEGSRRVPFSRELMIERDDFEVNPPKGYRRLAPGREVRLRFGYVVRYEGHDVDPATGEITAVRVTHDPDSRGGEAQGRSVSGTIHWVSAPHAVRAEVRLYERLFRVADPDEAPEADFTTFINPHSLEVLKDARIEPSVADAPAGTRWQFERVGYFWPDPLDSTPDRLVLNRVVGLRDSWAKKEIDVDIGGVTIPQPAEEPAKAPEPPPVSQDRGRITRDAARAADHTLARRMALYMGEHGLTPEEADLLTGDPAMGDFFEGALAASAEPRSVAAWVINELPREARGRALTELPFRPIDLGRLVALVDEGAVSRVAAKGVLAEMAEHGGDPEAILDRLGLRQVGDRGALDIHVETVLDSWPVKVQEYRAGKKGLLGFFVGQVVRASGGGADPKVVKEMLEERLGR